MAHGTPEDPFPADGNTQDDQLAALFLEYVHLIEAGGKLDEGQIQRDHPDLADELLNQLRTFQSLGSEPEAEAPPPLGTLGDYTLRRQIGRGGMGVVYEAWQGSLERKVALKVLPAGLAADTRATSRFLREAQVAAKLNHPQVVPVYGFGVEQNSPYYAMLTGQSPRKFPRLRR